MFMAEKLITTEEVQKQSNMAFKMRSGNKVSFKNMGSSPVRNMKTGSYEHSFESPAKQYKHGVNNASPYEEGHTDNDSFEKSMQEIADRNTKKAKEEKGKKVLEHGKKKVDYMQHVTGVNKNTKGELTETRRKNYLKSLDESPAKQKLNKGGEAQDQNKEFNKRGEHVGDWINGKLVMKPGFKRPVVKKDTPVKPTDEDMKKYSDLEKYDDDKPTQGYLRKKLAHKNTPMQIEREKKKK